MNLFETTVSHPDGPTMYSEVVAFHCAECERLRAGLVDADTLRRAEIESRNREIASLRAELAEKERECGRLKSENVCKKFGEAAMQHVIEICNGIESEQTARLRALCLRYGICPECEAFKQYCKCAAGRGEGTNGH